MSTLACWSCGDSAAEHPMPLSTYAECTSCQAQLHVCRMCKHWNPKLRIGCEETRAEDVSARETANFCEWFLPNLDAFQAIKKDREAQLAQAQLDKLFEEGGKDTETASAEKQSQEELEDLFKKTPEEIDEEHPPGLDHKDA